MRRLFLLTALVITSLCAFAQQLHNPFRLAGSKNLQTEFLQNVKPMANPFAQQMQRNLVQTRGMNMLRLNSMNGRHIASKPLNTEEYNPVTDKPAGEEKVFFRTGMNYFTQDGTNFYADSQHGVMRVVYDPDGKTVWFKEIVMDLAGYATWVKGTLNDDKSKVSIPLGQAVAYLDYYNEYLLLHMVKFDAAKNTYVLDETKENVEVAIEGDNLKFLGTDSQNLLSMVYSSDRVWAMLGDYETVLTPFNEETVSVPENLEAETYMMSAINRDNEAVTAEIKMGQVGDDVYIQGLLRSLPEAWLKAKKVGNDISIPNNQFMGLVSDFYPVWFIGADADDEGNLMETDFVLKYNEASKTYSSNMFMLENVFKDSFGYIGYYYNVQVKERIEVNFTTEIISEQPEGELKVYKRSGTSLSTYMGYPYVDPQEGYVMLMVYAPDGKTVYMKNPITQAQAGTWVKATKEGNKLVMPLYQSIDYSEQGDYYIYLAKVVAMDPNAETKIYAPDFTAQSVTFSIDEETGVISLDELKDDKAVLGLVFSNNMAYNDFADFNSVYTPHTEEMTVMPENLKQEVWTAIFHEEGEEADAKVVVAFDGDKVYMKNLPSINPEATLVGTLKDNKVSFATSQYLGLFTGQTDATTYFGGAKYRIEQEQPIPGLDFWVDRYYYDVIPALEMDYDAEKRTLAAPEGYTFLINATEPTEKVLYIHALSDPYFTFESDLTGISQELTTEGKEVKSVKYYNLKGMEITKPEKGISIQSVTFTDGSQKTMKIVR